MLQDEKNNPFFTEIIQFIFWFSKPGVSLLKQTLPSTFIIVLSNKIRCLYSIYKHNYRGGFFCICAFCYG